MNSAASDLVVNALPLPILTIGASGQILEANPAAEHFFELSIRGLQRQNLCDILPFGSPALSLVR